MTLLESKIRRAIRINKLNPEITGEREWHNHFIRVTELVWFRNNYDGYLIEIYESKYGKHLETIIV
jgi:hypothetical protein